MLTLKILRSEIPAVMASFGENLGKFRKLAGLTQVELAKRMGYSNNSQISAWENDKERIPEPENVRKAAEALSCTPAELMEDVALPHDWLRQDDDVIDVSDYKKFDIPVLAEGEASPNGLFWDNEGKPVVQCEEWMSRPGDVREKTAYAIVVRGDSMEPYLKRGYRLILSQTRPVREGDVVYAQLKSGERLIKVAHKQKGGYVLESYNQAYAPRFVATDEIGAIHKCVYVRMIN